MLAGELGEEELAAAGAAGRYFQTRLAPMVEGSVGSNQQEQGQGGGAGAGNGRGVCDADGGMCRQAPPHDASEL